MMARIANRICGGKRSTSRPTVSCATAPHRNTAVVRPPTSISEMPLMRSSTIFGSATEMVLKTRPALTATRRNSAKITTASVVDIDTSGDFERDAAWRLSLGANHR